MIETPKELTFHPTLYAIEEGVKGDARINPDGDFMIPFKNTYSACGIQLVKYSIPWSWTNCTSTTNTLVYTDSGVQKTIRIAAKQYSTISSLCSAIAEQMTVASGCQYTLAVSPITDLITFTSTKPFTISAASSLNKLLGIGDADIVANASFIATASKPFNLLPIPELQVHLPGLIKNLELTLGSSGLACAESVSLSTYSYGQYISNSESGEVFRFNRTNISGIVVRIVGLDGYTPEFNPDLPITLTFKLLYF